MFPQAITPGRHPTRQVFEQSGDHPRRADVFRQESKVASYLAPARSRQHDGRVAHGPHDLVPPRILLQQRNGDVHSLGYERHINKNRKDAWGSGVLPLR